MKVDEIFKEMEVLKKIPNVLHKEIGKSVLGQPIDAFFVGTDKGKQFLVEGAIHAREYINSLVIIQMIKYYSMQKLPFGVWFVPLVNTDGVGLCLEHLSYEKLSPHRKQMLLKINNANADFSLWKANIRGVDLNVHFDALWGGGRQNVKLPSSCNYIGKKPNSEPEVKTLIKFAKQVKPDLTLSFHSKGKVIYYGFETLTKKEIKRDYLIAKAIQKINGYKPVKTKKSTGGFSDWISMQHKVPALTVEVGDDKLKHPIGMQWLDTIFQENKNILFTCYQFLQK